MAPYDLVCPGKITCSPHFHRVAPSGSRTPNLVIKRHGPHEGKTVNLTTYLTTLPLLCYAEQSPALPLRCPVTPCFAFAPLRVAVVGAAKPLLGAAQPIVAPRCSALCVAMLCSAVHSLCCAMPGHAQPCLCQATRVPAEQCLAVAAPCSSALCDAVCRARPCRAMHRLCAASPGHDARCPLHCQAQPSLCVAVPSCAVPLRCSASRYRARPFALLRLAMLR